MLEFEENKIKISDNYIFRGKLKNKYLSEYNITRLYCNTIRYLYNNCENRFHKVLSYLFVLIPYCNIEYNIICYNIKENELSKVEILSLLDICDIIGYSRGNYHKLKNNLKKIKIKGKNIVAFVESENKESIIINPSLYYAGNNYGAVRLLAEFY